MNDNERTRAAHLPNIDRRRMLMTTGAVVMGATLLPGAASAQRPAEDTIAQWPPKPQQVARQMIAKYGPPHEITPSRLMWRDRAPWKETIVYREEIPHDFPMPHTDLLEQVIDYRVSPEHFAKLAAYDGSVIVERTKGTMGARCDVEEMNFLALNLAHDIVIGRRTVEDARRFYTETAKAFKIGQKPPYTERLQFTVAPVKTGDPDQPTV